MEEGSSRGQREGQPAGSHSQCHHQCHVPHQHPDEEGSHHGPYPVHPVVVPAVCHQSWPEGSGWVHAGSGHATPGRGTERLCHHSRTREQHPPSQCWDGAMRGVGAAAPPSQGSFPGLWWAVGLDHPGPHPGTAAWFSMEDGFPRQLRAAWPQQQLLTSTGLHSQVGEFLGQTQPGVEAPVLTYSGAHQAPGFTQGRLHATHRSHTGAGQEGREQLQVKGVNIW